MSISDVAMAFFRACEAGKGWAGCSPFCHETATFSCQSEALSHVETLAEYTEWMKGVLEPTPDGHYEIKGWAVDEDRKVVMAYAVFHATHTAPGGPVEPTGRSMVTDYLYAMAFDGDRICHLTKVWNDGIALRQFGWI